MRNRKVASLDTNILLRLVLGDVPKQTLLAEELIKKSAVLNVADIVIIEVVFVLEKIYKLSRKEVVESVYAIIRHPKINCNRKLFELTLPIYSTNAKLSIVDCALTQYAILNNATPLHTFDKALANYDLKNVVLVE